MDTLVEVGKWVLLVMAAGFIGQFGKSLALVLLERRKAGKARNVPPRAPGPDPAPHGAEDREAWKKRVKMEKKRLKAEAKKAKKSGLPPGGSVSG